MAGRQKFIPSEGPPGGAAQAGSNDKEGFRRPHGDVGGKSTGRSGKKSKPDIRVELDAALKQTIRPCTELDKVAIPTREEILGQWFLEGDLGFIFASRGLGKTWLTMAIASAIGNGGQCGAWVAPVARKILYVDGEMPYDAFITRSKGLEGNSNLLVLHHEALFHLTGKTLNLADPTTQEALTAWMLAAGIKVLALDNLSCLFMGIKENEADAWEVILHWLLTLRRHRIAVIVVHHSGRNKEMRGTTRREDAAFWVLRLDEIEEVDPKHGAAFLSRFTKDRNSKKEQPPLKWSIQTTGDGRVLIAVREARSMDVFRRWIEDGLECASDIAEEMNVTKGYIARLAKKAMEEGWLKKEGRKYVLVP